jgi:hypothetical protein
MWTERDCRWRERPCRFGCCRPSAAPGRGGGRARGRRLRASRRASAARTQIRAARESRSLPRDTGGLLGASGRPASGLGGIRGARFRIAPSPVICRTAIGRGAYGWFAVDGRDTRRAGPSHRAGDETSQGPSRQVRSTSPALAFEPAADRQRAPPLRLPACAINKVARSDAAPGAPARDPRQCRNPARSPTPPRNWLTGGEVVCDASSTARICAGPRRSMSPVRAVGRR